MVDNTDNKFSVSKGYYSEEHVDTSQEIKKHRKELRNALRADEVISSHGTFVTFYDLFSHLKVPAKAIVNGLFLNLSVRNLPQFSQSFNIKHKLMSYSPFCIMERVDESIEGILDTNQMRSFVLKSYESAMRGDPIICPHSIP